MAENQSAADKTEAPTPERLRKARERGQFVQSQEVPSAMILGILLISMVILLPSLVMWFRSLLTESITVGVSGAGSDGDGEVFRNFLYVKTGQTLMQIAPVLVICGVMSCFSGIVVSGLVYCPKNLKFDWKKVDPVKGMKNIVSMQSLAKLGFSILKLGFIGTICYIYLRERIEAIVVIRWAVPIEALSMIGGLVFGLLARVVVAMLVIAGLDYSFQRWNYFKKMRMSKQEVKEERKQQEVSQEVRSKVRQIQVEMTRKRMLQDVATADVVVANPTHVAVALQYDAKEMAAPLVVAKGPDLLCEKIKEIAREHDIPVVEKPALARALYAACEIGQPVPGNLFVAVAEVLAVIYRLRRKRKMMQL
ncbi:MAG: flagellar biosynthesis protein FlhB [Phycisphaerae bacterium]|nr:flagellar biosynthesis protein FlhB [Phycisphaerae bacterium]